MGKKYKWAGLLLIPAAVICLVLFLARNHQLVLLHPAGEIGLKERDLMITATLLMLIVVIPVFVLLFYIIWRYREENLSARYSPNWDGNRALELIWWALPFAIISILAVITWNSSHQLDPFRPIAGTRPLNIQVVALQWKWLFIYPDQKIATVNYVQFPAATPITFSITSDAPMNSFWIPSLGGQVYAMSGMDMKLHLIAEQNGEYQGSSANISGRGFAGMRFVAKATSQADFDKWAASVRRSPLVLSKSAYDKLAQPSQNGQTAFYSSPARNLYDRIVVKYMLPPSQISENTTLASVHGGNY